ncbi:helix-turn-helix domain-containing protein [Paenibacillus allorhizosphaerae]|uniref:Arabinose operon regulatory protein n=1 Tax=Paenibacillus allorhizosphaerae TaxID=2849866 RepID=A0ABM8VED0_9BACL|nr:AraC family transcriptional regulator [Paenibacillus allorhizosphaerae]CAG7630933.1 Arabinose operon regulatory protein [Paenibacillus allorhizosphaerae]
MANVRKDMANGTKHPDAFWLESLQIRFLHIQPHPLDYRWRIHKKVLRHSVLWFVEQGEFMLWVDGNPHRCKEGHICVMPANGVISARSTSREIRLTSINFDAEISFLSGQNWMNVLNVPVLFQGMHEELGPVISEMRTHSETPSPYVHLLMQSNMLRILFALLNKVGKDALPSSISQMDNRIHAIIQFLLAHPGKMPKIAELAELVQLSESHLRKLFIQFTKQAPLHFVHQLKVEQAQRILIHCTKPVSQVSRELGIDNANYFTKLFKAKTGLTPMQYRQKYGLWLNDE